MGSTNSNNRWRRCILAATALFFAVGLTGCPSSPVPEGDTGGADGGQMDAGPDTEGDVPDGGGQSCEPLPEVSEGVCNVDSGSGSTVLIRGTVLTPDGPLENGTIAYDKSEENARISCVGCDCADRPEYSDATVVTCPDGVVSPGLINPHDHLGWSSQGPYDGGMTRYDHRHEWRTGARGKPSINTPSGDFSRANVLHGELRHLLGGATSIAGSTRGTTPQGLLRNLDTPESTGGITSSVDYSTFPLGDVDGTLKTDNCDYRWDDSSVVLNNSIYLPHIAEGIDQAANNEFRCLSTFQDDARDLMEDNTSMIHGVGVSADDVYKAAAEGAQLVWSPRTNIALYGQTAPVPTYELYGVPIALGTDWPISGSMNMLRELSCAARLNETRYDDMFSDRQLWRMATTNGAKALGVSDRIGSIQTDYIADITLFDGRDAENPYRAVIEGDSQDIQLVARGGTALYGDQSVVSSLTVNDGGNAPSCETLDVCGETRSVCVERDTTGTEDGAVTLSSLQNEGSSSSYPLVSCEDESLEEPTCAPQRPGQYDGSTSENDRDGDGIPNEQDSCPSIFNPSTPLASGNQPDADDDGVGDVCDPCPLDAEDDCSSTDWDGDGELNADDNCPYTPNRAQADGDEDGIGDACDPSTTLYNINGGSHTVGDTVSVEEVVVTAVQQDDGNNAIFVQVPTDAERYAGAEESGAYVFLGEQAPPSRGDLVSFTGRLTDFFGLQRIENLSELSVDEENHEIPDPVTVNPCEVATGGAMTDEYTGVLLEVTDVTVTDENPDSDQGQDFGEFAVGSCDSRGGLRVDDLMHAVTPDPTEGESFNSIVGPLYYSFSNYKLEPRDEDDIVAGPARLKSLTPSTAYIRVGTTQQPTVPPLTVTASRASTEPTTVNLNYPDSGMLTGPDTVTIPANSKETTLPVTGVSVGASKTDTATVEADTGSQDLQSSEVLVYDDQIQRSPDELTFNSQVVNPDSTITATLRLDIPGATGGTNVTISTPSDASLPSSSVTVGTDSLETTFQFQSGSSTGTKDITASIDGRSITSSIDVQMGSTGECLILSEYIEGSGSNNKAIELYNCGGTTIDLTKVGVCTIFNDNSTCGSESTLSGPMLQPGEVYAVCKSSSTSTSGDPIAAISNNCDEELSSTINFNGNDRMIIFDDENGNGSYDSSNDSVFDQFGQPATEPSSSPWADKNLRRCDLSPYLGNSPFDYTDYFTEHPATDGSDYGQPPSPGVTCPSP